MTVSIIVVNWNTRELLGNCLRSIYADPYLQQNEIWVVDNASSDGSAHLVRAEFPQVRLIESPENLGFAAANNRAIRDISGDKVLLLNPDTEVEPGAIQALASFLEANPRAGAAGPMLNDSAGSVQVSVGDAPSLLGEFERLFHLESLFASTNRFEQESLRGDREVAVLQGACLMLRRTALDEIGLLDEDYFMYSEEVDLCRRLTRAGWTIHWVPKAKVIHHGGQSSRQAPIESFPHLYRGKVTYFRKHHGVMAALAYKAVLAAASLARLLVAPLALLEQSESRARHLDLAKRYGRLLMQMPGM